MTFVERGQRETLVQHLLRNREALGLCEDQVERLTMAYRLEIGTRAEQAEARRIGAAVKGELGEAMAQVVAWAKDRGEKVVQFNGAGAKRIRNRDGLQSLVDYKSIGEGEWQVGMAYRLLFETVAQGLRTAQLEPSNSRAAGARSGAMELQRAYAGVRLSSCDGALQAADPSLRMLKVVRAVAGEGRTVRSLGEGGATKAANLKALRDGLRVVAAELDRVRRLRLVDAARSALANHGPLTA